MARRKNRLKTRADGQRSGSNVYVELHNGHEFRFDIDRAYRILSKGIKAREERRGVFAYDFLYPEAILPPFIEPKNRDNAMYWLLSVFWDYSVGSNRFYRDFYFYISYFPEALDAKWLFDRGWKKNRNHIKKYMSHPNAKPGSKYFQSMLELLLDKYDGNPLNLVNDTDDINVARERIREFKNFEFKKANLLLLYYTRYGITTFANMNRHQVAVDTHKVRVPANLGIFDVVPNDVVREQACVDFMNRAYQELLKQHPDLEVPKIDDLLWVMGAKLCVEDLKGERNKTKWYRCMRDCPVEPDCKRVIGTKYGETFNFNVNMKPNFAEVAFPSGSVRPPTHEEVKGQFYDDLVFEPRVMPNRFPKRKLIAILEADPIWLRPSYDTIGVEEGLVVRVPLVRRDPEQVYRDLLRKQRAEKIAEQKEDRPEQTTMF
jgi:hypothetical protein